MFDSFASDFILLFWTAIALGIFGAFLPIFDGTLSEEFDKVFSSKVGFVETFQNIFEIVKVFTVFAVIGFVCWLALGTGIILLIFILEFVD